MKLKKLIAASAAGAAAIATLSIVGTFTPANAVPCDSANGNPPAVNVPGVGCAYVGADQVVLADGAASDAGYIGVSSRDRDGSSNGGLDRECNEAHGTVPNTATNNTNGGGCYFLDYSAKPSNALTDAQWAAVVGLLNTVDTALLGDADGDLDLDLRHPALAAVPLLVGGDTSGDYNNTSREGQGAAVCDIPDTIDDFLPNIPPLPPDTEC